MRAKFPFLPDMLLSYNVHLVTNYRLPGFMSHFNITFENYTASKNGILRNFQYIVTWIKEVFVIRVCTEILSL